jgi:hypothetical protein
MGWIEPRRTNGKVKGPIFFGEQDRRTAHLFHRGIADHRKTVKPIPARSRRTPGGGGRRRLIQDKPFSVPFSSSAKQPIGDEPSDTGLSAAKPRRRRRRKGKQLGDDTALVCLLAWAISVNAHSLTNPLFFKSTPFHCPSISSIPLGASQ